MAKLTQIANVLQINTFKTFLVWGNQHFVFIILIFIFSLFFKQITFLALESKDLISTFEFFCKVHELVIYLPEIFARPQDFGGMFNALHSYIFYYEYNATYDKCKWHKGYKMKRKSLHLNPLLFLSNSKW